MGNRKALEFVVVVAIALAFLLMLMPLLRNAIRHRGSVRQQHDTRHRTSK